MRTTLEIDDEQMAQAMKASGAKTKRKAVELGLKTLLTLKRQKAVPRLRIQINWHGDLDAASTH